jgi:PAS domain S-box-containing protein
MTLKILCVDDDEVDRKIIQRKLKQRFEDELVFEAVATANEAFEKLKGDKFDIILLDYMLGNTTGLEFLNELDNKGISSPVILLTGLGNEDVAVEALKLGAYDYFTKEQLGSKKITQSIINITERKKAEEEILFERKKLQNIMDSMIEGITITDMEGKIISVNNAALAQLGYEEDEEDEVIDKNIREVFFEEKDATKFKEIIGILASGQPLKAQDFMFKRKDKTRFHASLNLSVLSDPAGQTEEILAVHRDVTEQKITEVQLKNLVGELSTPILHAFEEIIIMPLVGTLTSDRSERAMQTVLDSIDRFRAKYAIIDITGVSVIDSMVAGQLIKTARAVESLGSTAIITGISADIAMTFVELGISMEGVITKNSLLEGLQYAIKATEKNSRDRR